MTDHEINVKLARFMGWREVPFDGPVPQCGEFTACEAEDGAFGNPGVWHGPPLAPEQPTYWSPATQAEQAIEVMAEVARRGGRVETAIHVHEGAAYAKVWVFAPALGGGMYYGDSTAKEDNPVAAWCRAVCLAVVAAINASQPGDHE